MKRLILTGCLFLIAAHLFGQSKPRPIKIKWAQDIQGNFSFKNNWSYPEGIIRNQYGQLTCDGFCPPEAEAMMDSTGKILKDSIAAFYGLVDTVHQSHTIECKAWCYEWAGTDFINAVRKSADSVYCYTLLNATTHCSLQLDIAGDNCYAVIDLSSVADGNNIKYHCNNGYISIDKTLWDSGILKAAFDFSFEHKENPKQRMYWKGKIYSKIVAPESNIIGQY